MFGHNVSKISKNFYRKSQKRMKEKRSISIFHCFGLKPIPAVCDPFLSKNLGGGRSLQEMTSLDKEKGCQTMYGIILILWHFVPIILAAMIVAIENCQQILPGTLKVV